MSGKTVLIADDDRALAEALAIRCRALGLETRVTHDGMQAYDVICAAPPDLLILDISMPAVTGLHLCDELARDPEHAPIPTIILTGKSDEETVRHCERLGARYVWKGLETWNQLEPLIREMLQLAPSPEATATPTPAPAASTPAPVAAPSASSAGTATVLVIDDDPDISKTLQVRLAPFGVRTLRAFNGMQGLWLALKEHPAVIITDYAMPDGQGDYVLRRLAEHAVTARIPVIVLTGRAHHGHPDSPLASQMADLGAAAFLTKPLDFDALLHELRKHVVLAEPAATSR